MEEDIIRLIEDNLINKTYPKPTRLTVQDTNREEALYKLFEKDTKNIRKVINLIISTQPAYMIHRIGLNKEIALPNIGTFKPRKNNKLIKNKVLELKEANVPLNEYGTILKAFARKLRLSTNDDTLHSTILNNIKKTLKK